MIDMDVLIEKCFTREELEKLSEMIAEEIDNVYHYWNDTKQATSADKELEENIKFLESLQLKIDGV